MTAINIAFSDFKTMHPNLTTVIQLHTRDSQGDSVTAAAAADALLQSGLVQVIIGPQNSDEAAFVAALGTKTLTPIISFSAASPAVSPVITPYFIRSTVSAAAQCRPIAAVIAAFAWHQAVTIHEDTVSFATMTPYLTDALDAAGIRAHRGPIPPSASDDRITAELYKLISMSTRVFILHASLPLASRIFSVALAAGMDEGYVWIVTDAIINLLSMVKLPQGVIGVRPYIPKTEQVKVFERRWGQEFLNSVGLTVYDLWAYDTLWAVATAATASGGSSLRDAILAAEFGGLAGRFRVVGGELQVAAFEIVNMVGGEAREIGMWTLDGGLSGLGAVIWPGESTVRPRGWEIPASGRRLRIAVPGAADKGFSSFLSVEREPATNRTKASGFVIEAFEAAVAVLPYALPFEYVSYVAANGERAGDYNELMYEVSLKAFPRGSPLTGDMSRAILNITDGGQMATIEKKWFGDLTTCLSNGNTISSDSLDLSSFWGLFLITGTASVLSLCFGLILFLYQDRDVLSLVGRQSSLWWRLVTMAKHFDTRDLSFHTFRRGENKGGTVGGTTELTTSPPAKDLGSPASIYSNAGEEGGTWPSTPT